MVVELRAGRKQYVDPGREWGVRVVEPGFPSVAGGWWDDNGAIGCCIAAYSPEGAADYNSSKIDLSTSGNNAVEGAAPPWDPVNGWQFDGATQWLDTTVGPPADGQAPWSLLIKFTSWTAGDCAVGVGDFLLRGFDIYPDRAGSVRYMNGGTVGVGPGLAAGILGVAGNQGYRNGVADGGAIPPMAGMISGRTIYVGAQHLAAGPGWWCALCVLKLSIYDCVLAPAEMAAVTALM